MNKTFTGPRASWTLGFKFLFHIFKYVEPLTMWNQTRKLKKENSLHSTLGKKSTVAIFKQQVTPRVWRSGRDEGGKGKCPPSDSERAGSPRVGPRAPMCCGQGGIRWPRLRLGALPCHTPGINCNIQIAYLTRKCERNMNLEVAIIIITPIKKSKINKLDIAVWAIYKINLSFVTNFQKSSKIVETESDIGFKIIDH